MNSHGVTCIPHPDPPSHLPLHPIPLGLPSAGGLSTCLTHPTHPVELLSAREHGFAGGVSTATSTYWDPPETGN